MSLQNGSSQLFKNLGQEKNECIIPIILAFDSIINFIFKKKKKSNVRNVIQIKVMHDLNHGIIQILPMPKRFKSLVFLTQINNDFDLNHSYDLFNSNLN